MIISFNSISCIAASNTSCFQAGATNKVTFFGLSTLDNLLTSLISFNKFFINSSPDSILILIAFVSTVDHSSNKIDCLFPILFQSSSQTWGINGDKIFNHLETISGL